jgi:arylsulfatase A-like enzyme
VGSFVSWLPQIAHRARFRLRPCGVWCSTIAAAVLAALGGGCGNGGAGEGDAPAWETARPNVILIVVDTLRRDRLGVYGHEPTLTPAVDAFAADAVRYEEAYAQAPWTTPSVGALLASRYPQALGITRRRSALPEEPVLLPETLQGAGYETGAVVSNLFCSSRWNFGQGFSFFDDSVARGYEDVTSSEVTDRAIEFVDRDREGPFFLWIHYFDPHFLYVLHPEFVPPTDYEGRINDAMGYEKLDKLQEKGLTDADVAEMFRRYDSEVGYTDRQVGRFLAHLRERGLYENAVVIFTADHGEAFLEQGVLGHGRTLQQDLVNVPLLMKIPGVAPGVVESTVQLVDVAPTVLDRLGLPEPSTGFVGRSLLGQPDEEEPHPAFFSTMLAGDTRGVVIAGMKLTERKRTGERVLFDVDADPGERNNLAAEQPQTVEALGVLLDAWADQVQEGKEHAVELDLTDAERERLEALGYVQ